MTMSLCCGSRRERFRSRKERSPTRPSPVFDAGLNSRPDLDTKSYADGVRRDGGRAE
jgi:hypothetical protein